MTILSQPKSNQLNQRFLKEPLINPYFIRLSSRRRKDSAGLNQCTLTKPCKISPYGRNDRLLDRGLLSTLSIIILLMVTSLYGPILADNSTGFTVESLFQQLKKTEPFKIKFEEIKTIAFLDIPIQQEGTLEFRPPDFLQRKTGTTSTEITTISGDKIIIEKPSKIKTVSLDEHPAIRAFVSAFRAPLTGNIEEIKSIYDTSLTGSEASWVLVLRPLKSSLSSFLEEVIISGESSQVSTIETKEAGGDSSYLILKPQR